MEVVSLCPLPVAGLLWSTADRGWSLTIVCKATYELANGELKLKAEQLGLNRIEQHYDDEAMCSVYAPADLAPFKPRIDVVVVGHGYAATKTAQVVTARVEVNDVRKSVRVYGARTRDSAGKKGPTASFKKVPLRYERAAGGPGTVNPVGVPPEGVAEPDGSHVLPNLELVDDSASSDAFAAFGPVAATWPSRRKKLGRYADEFSIGSWWEEPFPADLDLSFFNVAPDDQQLDTLKAGDVLTLQHMHEEHTQLAVTIPNLAPQAFLEVADGEDEILNMRCDTVWIDTSRNVLTLTWRGHLRLDNPDSRARCFVAASHDGTALSKDDIQPLLDKANIGEIPGPPSLGLAIGLGGGEESIAGHRGQLLEVHTLGMPAPTGSQTQTSLEQAASSSQPPASDGGPSSSDSGALSHDSGALSPDSEALPSGERTSVSAPPSMLTTDDVMLISSDQLESIPPSTEGGFQGPRIVKLVWVDRSRIRAIRSGWRELLVSEPRIEQESPQKELHDVHRVFVSAYPSSALDIEGSVAEAVEVEREFEAPLVLSSGELRLSFDELAYLRATVTAASPFAAGQYELEQLLTAARNMLTASWVGTADGVATEVADRIRETFSSATRGLPPGFLDAQAKRIVVTERCFQYRNLWGRRWLRATFTPVHSHVPFTAYIPHEVAEYLPLFDQFFARIIAHIDLREDQFETHPLALRVCAISRVVDAPAVFSRR